MVGGLNATPEVVVGCGGESAVVEVGAGEAASKIILEGGVVAVGVGDGGLLSGVVVDGDGFVAEGVADEGASSGVVVFEFGAIAARIDIGDDTAVCIVDSLADGVVGEGSREEGLLNFCYRG